MVSGPSVRNKYFLSTCWKHSSGFVFVDLESWKPWCLSEWLPQSWWKSFTLVEIPHLLLNQYMAEETAYWWFPQRHFSRSLIESAPVYTSLQKYKSSSESLYFTGHTVCGHFLSLWNWLQTFSSKDAKQRYKDILLCLVYYTQSCWSETAAHHQWLHNSLSLDALFHSHQKIQRTQTWVPSHLNFFLTFLVWLKQTPVMVLVFSCVIFWVWNLIFYFFCICYLCCFYFTYA